MTEHAGNEQNTKTTAPRRSTTKKRVGAILIGGLVLGVGATATLAAWNDSEFATGTFSAGTFNLQGSTTSETTGFADNASAPGQSLSFTAGFDSLSPTDTVYSPLWVRLAANTSAGAALTVSSVDSTDTSGTNSAQLGYTIYELATNTTTCDAAGVAGATTLASAATLADNAAVTSADVLLTPGAPTTNAGVAAKLCIVVTASATLEQGGVTSATWQFAAASNS